MYYNNLRRELDSYCSFLQSTFKSNVQISSGSLRDSIRVSCLVNDREYSLSVNLNNYWRFLLNPIPVDSSFAILGIDVHEPTRFPQDSGVRYPINFSDWQVRLNSAFESDILSFLNC